MGLIGQLYQEWSHHEGFLLWFIRLGSTLEYITGTRMDLQKQIQWVTVDNIDVNGDQMRIRVK